MTIWLLIGAAILLVCIAASRFSGRFGVPMLLVFIALGMLFGSDGLFKIQAASDSKRFGLRPWWLILTLAIMACLAGLLLVFRPMDGARALLVLLGIAMLAEGILNLCVACSMIKIIRHQQPDVLDAEFYEKRG